MPSGHMAFCQECAGANLDRITKNGVDLIFCLDCAAIHHPDGSVVHATIKTCLTMEQIIQRYIREADRG